MVSAGLLEHNNVHQSWLEVLGQQQGKIDAILERISSGPFFPSAENIFRALRLPVPNVKVIILGQDPYPTPGMAEGLAFSVPVSVSKLPPSLKNIFREYSSDLQLPMPTHGHLGDWVDAGALLLNRILTVKPGEPLSHKGLGWEEVTDSILQYFSALEVPIICWGASAYEAALRANFARERIFESAHPSPLSAYRGFFGSRPFSRVNTYLLTKDKAPIQWRLQ